MQATSRAPNSEAAPSNGPSQGPGPVHRPEGVSHPRLQGQPWVALKPPQFLGEPFFRVLKLGFWYLLVETPSKPALWEFDATLMAFGGKPLLL